MKKRKSRKDKENIYKEKYSHIPINYEERLNWMCDEYNIKEKKMIEILNKRDDMMSSLFYREFTIVLFEEPEGTPRPRFRLINRQNIVNQALSNGSFVHVYSLNAKEDNMYMQRLVNEDLYELNNYIWTPCIVEFNAYFKTPSIYNITDTMLSEIGLIRPIVKPDWDNIGKKYSDMFNSNVWIDDTLVIEGTVKRFYSILPRVEIKLRYLNTLYNKHQYNSINNKIDFDINYFKGDEQ